jgi:membrane protein YqaA with SNARE-associated domain
MDLAAHRHANWALASVSCIESSIFPIPPDVLLIPMVLARREQAFRIALVFTVASILSRGLRFYVVAWLLWRFGASIEDFIERRLHLLFWLFCALLIGGFVLIRYLV